MSLKSISLDSIPNQTVRIARTAFPKGNTYLKLRDQFGSIYEDADFDQLFPKGRASLRVAKGKISWIGKNCLQHYATVAAINIVRLGGWWMGRRVKTRESAMA